MSLKFLNDGLHPLPCNCCQHGSHCAHQPSSLRGKRDHFCLPCGWLREMRCYGEEKQNSLRELPRMMIFVAFPVASPPSCAMAVARMYDHCAIVAWPYILAYTGMWSAFTPVHLKASISPDFSRMLLFISHPEHWLQRYLALSGASGVHCLSALFPSCFPFSRFAAYMRRFGVQRQ
jgi:hypothetical protein